MKIRVFIYDGVVYGVKTDKPDADIDLTVVDFDSDTGDKAKLDAMLNDPEFHDVNGYDVTGLCEDDECQEG